jgi:hypothetical protein
MIILLALPKRITVIYKEIDFLGAVIYVKAVVFFKII